MSVSLVCMPWHALAAPSIQLGILQAVLQDAGVACTSHSSFLQFLHHLGAPRGPLTPEDYLELGDRWFMHGTGEWVFALPPVRRVDAARDREYLAGLRRAGVSQRAVEKLCEVRARVPDFLEACADEILASGARVVGFTTTSGQTIASLALAARLKARAPDITIVFGGANCDSTMGEALHRSFQQVDVVVRGEGEAVVVPLMRALLAGKPAPRLPGVCLREGGTTVAVAEQPGRAIAMDQVPAPDYDEYFARLHRLGFDTVIQPTLPLESSRGCWWGARSHCTFCGLNGERMTQRSKSGARVVAELEAQARAHRVLDFTMVDNILDLAYFDTMLPALAARGLDLRLFYQTKANLSLAQVRQLRVAGVRWIRPGIESLSTAVLRLMRKGVTALQNIRLLKWCARYDLHVAWNLIHGLPDVPDDEYARMSRLLPSLIHLSPPGLSPLTVDRFSPYQRHPERHGIRLLGAPIHYRALYDLDDDTLRDLAWTFAFDLVAGGPSDACIANLHDAVLRWRTEAHANKGALTWRRGPGFLVVDDRRTTTEPSKLVLDELEARVYLACDAGARPDAVARALTDQLGTVVDGSSVLGILREFVAARVMYEENGTFLSLALAAEPTTDDAGAGPMSKRQRQVTHSAPTRPA
ncbi:MAG: RiPP maturation radical SAM C-methyltransferase [Planctomycetota bacterium]